jgi:hypothetical protein
MPDDDIIRRPQLNQRRRGRPPGSRNKPKVDKEVADQLKDTIGPYLPKEDLDYLLQSLAGTVDRELDQDLLILLSLQLKALLPVLAEEIREGKLSREATQRSSTVKELLALWLAKQKQEKGDDGTGNTFIQNILISRNIDPEQIARLVGAGPDDIIEGQSRLLPGSLDLDAERPDEVGAVPDRVSEGQE